MTWRLLCTALPALQSAVRSATPRHLAAYNMPPKRAATNKAKSPRAAKKTKPPPGAAQAEVPAVSAVPAEPPKPKKATKKAESIPRTPTPRRFAAAGERVFRVLSVNVAGLRAVLNNPVKLARFTALVAAERPDLLCLNEHKLKEADVDEATARLAEAIPGYTAGLFSCSKPPGKLGYSGVAVLRRDTDAYTPADPVPMLEGFGGVATGDDIIDSEGRAVTAELPELSVVAVYVPNSGSALARLQNRVDPETGWDMRFAKYITELRARRGKPVVVIGDLNVCHGVRDIHNMHARKPFPDDLEALPLSDQYTGLKNLLKAPGLTPEERSSFGSMLSTAGLLDAFRWRHPAASGAFSYYSQRFPANRAKNKGLRLDYVLADHAICADDTGPTNGNGGVAAVAASATASGSGGSGVRLVDSYILDGIGFIADHVAVGCDLVLPGLKK